MLPLNYDTPVIDELGKIHPFKEYTGGGGDISDAIPVFTSDDTIQNPTQKISMPLFQSGNALKDLLRWISKAMQNIRYLLKFTEDISTDLNTTIEQVEDINTNLVKEWTDISVARAGEYYWHNNLIWKALVDTANTPAEGSEWHNVKVMDEVSELNSNFNEQIEKIGVTLIKKNSGTSVTFTNQDRDTLYLVVNNYGIAVIRINGWIIAIHNISGDTNYSMSTSGQTIIVSHPSGYAGFWSVLKVY